MAPGAHRSSRHVQGDGAGAGDDDLELAVTAPDRANAFASALVAARSPRGRGGSGRGGSGEVRERGLFDDEELRAIEDAYADGITAVQVVDLFVSRGVRFSEATFRKYVQQGLLPRSRRVGRKGKNRGSMGMYPAKTVRRVNAIKRLMADGYTIEEIQDQFLRFTDVIESLEEGISEIFSRFESEAQSPRFDNQARRNLKREISEARKTADELLKRIDGLSRRVLAPRDERYRSTGAAGSAEDLL
jgi:DNA-binding transcriptional MerR regulator